MTGETENQELEQGKETGTYAQESAIDEALLQRYLNGEEELPEGMDFHELEARLGFDSDDKGQYAEGDADKPSTAETPDAENQDDKGQKTETGEKPEGKPEEGKPQEKAEPETSSASEQQQGKKTEQPEPEGVLLKDGKHVAPYTVLKNTREQLREERARREEAEQRLQEHEEKLRRVAQDQENAQEKLGSAQAKQDNLLSRFGIERQDLPVNEDGTLDVETLRGEYPDNVVDLLAATNQIIVGLTKEIDDLNASRQEQEYRERNLRQQTVQDAIDATPELAEIQSEGGRRWNIARSIDRELREDPDWATAPMRVRFAEVAHLMKGGKPRTVQEAELAFEQARQTGPSSPTTKSDSPASQAGNPQERADQRLREQSHDAGPTTHTDLPAGERPSPGGLDQLQNMDPIQLEKMLENAEDQDAVLNRLLTQR